jgi:hypothetical protein
MDAATAKLITSPDALALLASLPPYDESAALSLGQSLRDHGADPAMVAAVMTQSRLRHGAQAKFGDFAAGMLFTPDGLEQATRLSVAALHAQRFRDAGLTRIADLTCGIGADAMAASALGLTVMAFETDEATALVADHNLRHWPDTVVVHADSLATVRGMDIDGAFADPARRSSSGRRHDPRDYTPALEDVLALRDQLPALGVKVGPGIPHQALPADAETQWVSADGSVVEAALWCGPLAHHHGHSALVIRGGDSHVLTGDVAPAPVGAIGDYLMEPDGAVIRSGLVGALALQTGTHVIDPSIAYLSSDSPTATSFGTTYRILESFPYSVKRLASALRERGVGRVEIKKRGLSITPEKLRPKLKLSGDNEATVVIARIGEGHQAMIVERLTPSR